MYVIGRDKYIKCTLFHVFIIIYLIYLSYLSFDRTVSIVMSGHYGKFQTHFHVIEEKREYV